MSRFKTAHSMDVFLLLSITALFGQNASPSNEMAAPQSYYANAHPYLEEPLERLRTLIPELKGVQPSLDQKELRMILQKTGQRVDDFTKNLDDLIVRERVEQEARNWKLELLGSQLVEDNYLILAHNNGFITRIQESRLDLLGNPVKQPRGKEPGEGVFAPGYRISSGFASSTVYFATGQQSSSTFRYFGTERIGDADTYVVGFAQLPSEATITTLWSGQGDQVQMLVQGVAWVDKSNFEIIKIRTDLLAPRPEIGLDQQSTEVTLSEVRLRDIASPLWLPKVVKVDLAERDSNGRFKGQIFRNEHHYANYRRYRASAKMNDPQ